MKRRDILKLGSCSAFAYGVRPVFAGADNALSPEMLYARFVPKDKGLPRPWLDSLTTRGHALDTGIAASKKDGKLDVIGMTAGGVACGTVYLSGDGRLWVWDIFNQHHAGVVPNNTTPPPKGLETIQGRKGPLRELDGANFLAPPSADTHTNGVVQGFRLEVEGEKARTMDAKGWAQVEFEPRGFLPAAHGAGLHPGKHHRQDRPAQVHRHPEQPARPILVEPTISHQPGRRGCRMEGLRT